MDPDPKVQETEVPASEATSVPETETPVASEGCAEVPA
jgi:hypothetical protein